MDLPFRWRSCISLSSRMGRSTCSRWACPRVSNLLSSNPSRVFFKCSEGGGGKDRHHKEVTFGDDVVRGGSSYVQMSGPAEDMIKEGILEERW